MCAHFEVRDTAPDLFDNSDAFMRDIRPAATLGTSPLRM